MFARPEGAKGKYNYMMRSIAERKVSPPRLGSPGMVGGRLKATSCDGNPQPQSFEKQGRKGKEDEKSREEAFSALRHASMRKRSG